MIDPPMLAKQKSDLRYTILARLKAMDDAARREASRAVSVRLLELDEVRDAGAVLFYMATRLEIDPGAAITDCLSEGIRVAVPKVDEESGEIEAVEIESLDSKSFERDSLGILVPRAGELIRATELDAVIVPGVAFDRRGLRLGRGAGFYDRLLVRLTPRCRTIGLAFSCQLVDAVPAEAHDRRVDVLVTESATMECGAERSPDAKLDG